MTIDRLGPIDPASQFNKANTGTRAVRKDTSDTVSLSSQAKAMGEIYQATQDVKKAPDVRMDKVEEAKRKLQDPSYLNDKVIAAVADKVMELFDL